VAATYILALVEKQKRWKCSTDAPLVSAQGEVPDTKFVMRRECGLVLQPEALAESRLLGALSSQHAIKLVHEGVTLLLVR
jgi:hypothetical protein